MEFYGFGRRRVIWSLAVAKTIVMHKIRCYMESSSFDSIPSEIPHDSHLTEKIKRKKSRIESLERHLSWLLGKCAYGGQMKWNVLVEGIQITISVYRANAYSFF